MTDNDIDSPRACPWYLGCARWESRSTVWYDLCVFWRLCQHLEWRLVERTSNTTIGHYISDACHRLTNRDTLMSNLALFSNEYNKFLTWRKVGRHRPAIGGDHYPFPSMKFGSQQTCIKGSNFKQSASMTGSSTNLRRYTNTKRHNILRPTTMGGKIHILGCSWNWFVYGHQTLKETWVGTPDEDRTRDY